jgi:hypothetical protein
MRLNKITGALTFLIMLSMSCSFLTGLTPNSGDNHPATQPPIASGNGPTGFTAHATSPESVLLTWSPVDGATGYQLDVKIPDQDFVTIINLDADQTRYEDFMAPADSQLTYRVQAVTSSGSSGATEVAVITAPRQPNPLTVQPEFDVNSTVTQTVGASGGSVMITDGKGVSYQLDIPAGALDQDTEIKLTTVTNIGGWPLDGNMLGAVKIEPEGLQLNDVATLSITLPGDAPIDNLSTLGFAFDGSGGEFHLEPAYKQKSTTGLEPQKKDGIYLASLVDTPVKVITLPVIYLEAHGVGTGSSQSAGNLVKSNSPTDAGAASDQQQAVNSSEGDELAPLTVVNDYANLLERAAFNVFNTISKADGCAETRSAVGSVTGWLWEAQFRNLNPAEIQRGHDTMVKDLSDKIKQVIDEAADKCKKQKGGPSKSSPPGTGCAKGLIRSVASGSTQLFKDIQKQMLKDYGTGALNDPEAELRHCSKAYTVNASVPSGSVSGNICSLEQLFTLNMSGKVSGTLTFFPSNQNGGRVQEEAEGVGVTFGGTGTYTISGTDSDNPTLSIEFAETSHTPLGDFSHNQSAVLPLNPLEEGACQP